MDIFDLLDHNGQSTVFHGVQGATLRTLVSESEDGQIHLYGRSHRDSDEAEDEDVEALSHVRDGGYLYVTEYSDIEFSANEFAGDGLILVLGVRERSTKPEIVTEVSRERVIKLAEWQVIGAIRPAFDEESGELDEENMQALSLEEIFEEV